MSQQTVGFIEYTAQGGDTFDSIALAAYNEERMASTIIAANPDLSDGQEYCKRNYTQLSPSEERK